MKYWIDNLLFICLYVLVEMIAKAITHLDFFILNLCVPFLLIMRAVILYLEDKIK